MPRCARRVSHTAIRGGFRRMISKGRRARRLRRCVRVRQTGNVAFTVLSIRAEDEALVAIAAVVAFTCVSLQW